MLFINSKRLTNNLTFSSVRAGGVCMISVDNIIIWTDIGWWILAQMVPLILTHTRRHAAATAGWMDGFRARSPFTNHRNNLLPSIDTIIKA